MARNIAGHDHEQHEEQTAQVEEDRLPIVEFFVKCGSDDTKVGACTICQQYFMAFYVLRECGLIHLLVTTFKPSNPPADVLKISSGKRCPVVRVHRGYDANDVDLTDHCCDQSDEIENLIERFDCADLQTSKQSSQESEAEKVFQDMYGKFRSLLKNNSSQPIQAQLRKLDNYLKEQHERSDSAEPVFMNGSRLTLADCYLLPRLQHLKVAGKAYCDFKITRDFPYVRKYLRDAKMQPAFERSCPEDRDIVLQYMENGKACSAPKVKPLYMGEVRSLDFSSDEEELGNHDNHHAHNDHQYEHHEH